MDSVDICYLKEYSLPPEVRQQIEHIRGARIASGSRLCIALMGEAVLGAISFRVSNHFARIDFLEVAPNHLHTKLSERLLFHALQQLHKNGIFEVYAGVNRASAPLFSANGFMEENISIPGMHAESDTIELVHPNLRQLKPRFELIRENVMDSKPPVDTPIPNPEKRSITYDSLGSYRDLTRMVLCNAQRKVRLLCQDLEDPVLSDQQIIKHIQSVVLSTRQAQVMVILEDDRHRPTTHNPILELAHRLPSFVSIRRIQDKRVTPKEWLYICDEHHAVVRKREHGFKGEAHIESPIVLQRLSYQFENLWQHSVPSSQLRRLAM